MRTTIVILLLIAAGAGGYYWWQQQQTPPEQAVAPAAPPTEQAPVAEAPAEPAIKYPIEEATPKPEASETAPSAANADDALAAALTDLLGRDAIASFVRLTDFPRRAVATVDNLARTHAPPRAWPINPTPGQFTVEQRGDAHAIAGANSERYAPFVRLVESIDTARAVALYVKFYPLFQRAYEEIGYPGRYFNDRLVAVIDQLLATPDIDGPLEVARTEVKRDTPSAQPWVEYRYTDPKLEALAAGQKALLRMGPDHRQRLKAKLRDVRRHITGDKAPRAQ